MTRQSRSRRTSSKNDAKKEIEESLRQYELDKKQRKAASLTKESFQNDVSVRLTDKQTDLFKGIRNNTLTVVHGPAGTSKAQPIDSPVLTPTGWVKMGEIEIGDRVISSDGTSTIVTGIYPQGLKDICEITFSDGAKVECCSDHLWLTQTEKDRNNRKHEGYNQEGKRIRVKNELPGTVKTTEEIINTLYTKRGRINHTIPITSPVNFETQDIEIDPYVMGCLIGDGCFRGNKIGFTTSDIKIIDNFKSLVENDDMIISNISDIDHVIIKEKTTYKNKYKQYLIKIGIWNKLSSEKFIPLPYKFNSIDNRIKLLRGLMDTDGSVSKDGTYVNFTSVSKRLINDVKELVQSLGGIATDQTPKVGKYYYNGELKEGQIAYRLTIKMNPDINPFSLERKGKKVKPKSKYKPTRYIVSAKLIGKKEAKCIKVDHDSRLYLTNDYVVTHNTFTSCYTALSLLADRKIDKIIITKPIQESGEQIGLLPGTVDEKIDPYKQSYYTNFCKILDRGTIDWLFSIEEIVFEPLAYMRGSTYDNCIMLLDEAQNSSIKQLMLWSTRLGKDSKAVMMGDTSQYDVKKKDSGYVDFIDMTNGMNDLFMFEFKNEDIVRNKFLIELTNRYDKYRSERPNI